MFQPVEVEEMAFAMTLFVSAARGQISSGRKPLTVKNREEGVKLFMNLSSVSRGAKQPQAAERELDTDLFRAFLIVWEHYRNDRLQASIGARLLGFYHLMVRTRGEALQAWVEPLPSTEETIALHPSVIETIASVELTNCGKLDEVRFLSDLEATRIASIEAVEAVDIRDTWPVGTGEMVTRVREFDWNDTPLGPIAEWPQSLRTTVDLVLACRFPMIILWGQELIQIYNDGYCSLMGTKHPRGVGQPTRECWPEIWHINDPIFTQVRSGQTVTIEDGLYPNYRHGHLEDAYFTLCYSPLRAETAAIAGILVTVFETTERVQAELKASP